MSWPPSNRPKCSYCGKPLKPETFVVKKAEEGVPSSQEVIFKFRDGRVLTNRGVTRVQYRLGRWHYFCWGGRWGYMGRGFFCKLTCGWLWAVRHLGG